MELDRHPALLDHAVELRQEIDVKERAAEFTVGDAAQAEVLLELDDLADRAILDRAQLGGRKRCALRGSARLEQILRPQETADVIGAKRRLRGLRDRLRMGIHALHSSRQGRRF